MRIQLPQQTLFYQLEKAMKRYRKLAQATIDSTGYDISINQMILLMNLKDNPTATQVELSDLIFKDFASIARMVDLLVKKGLLKRKESKLDRRKKDLILTPKGHQILEEISPLVGEYRSHALKGFDEKEVLQMSAFLIRLIQNCEEEILVEELTS
ncbi:MAG: MarR family transcriptional regulator [Bacteroidota bacterium]